METTTLQQQLAAIQDQLARLSEQVQVLTEQAEANRRRWEVLEDLEADLTRIGHEAALALQEELKDLEPYVRGEDLIRLLKRLLQNAENLEWALEQLESLRDLTRDATPVVNEALQALIQFLDELDKKGYVPFFLEALRILDVIVTSFSVEDVRLLGDNIVLILNTVKEMTQPEMMRFLHNLTMAFKEGTEEEEPDVSLLGLLRQMRDPKVRKGLALSMQMLRIVAENREMAARYRNGGNGNGQKAS